MRQTSSTGRCLTPTEEVLLTDWLEQVKHWATTERDPQLSRETMKDYMQDLKGFARWTETALRLPFTPELLTLDNAEAWKQHDLTRGRRPNSVNRALAALRLFAEWMRRAGLTDEFVLARLAQVPRDQVEGYRWLELEEIVRLYRAIRMVPRWNHRRRVMTEALIRIMVEAGLRLDEVANLRLEDITLASDDQARLLIRTGRRGHSRRVAMGPDLVQVLTEWLSLRNDGSPWLFPGSGEAPLSITAIGNVVRLAAQTAGLHGVTCQTLRVTCGHMLYRKTKDLWLVAAVMGHFSADGQPFPGGCVNYVYHPGMVVPKPDVQQWDR